MPLLGLPLLPLVLLPLLAEFPLDGGWLLAPVLAELVPEETADVPELPDPLGPWPDCVPSPHAANANSAETATEKQIVFIANHHPSIL